MILCSGKQKRHTFKVLTIRDVHRYVVDSVNFNTIFYWIYNSPHSQKCGQNRNRNLSITVLYIIDFMYEEEEGVGFHGGSKVQNNPNQMAQILF